MKSNRVLISGTLYWFEIEQLTESLANVFLYRDAGHDLRDYKFNVIIEKEKLLSTQVRSILSSKEVKEAIEDGKKTLRVKLI